MRRIIKPTSIDYSYQIFGPTGSKPSFRIKRINPDGTQKSIKDPRLGAINRQFKDGVLTRAETLTQVELLREQFYKSDGVKIARVESNSENEKLLRQYMDERITKRIRTKAHSKLALERYLRRGIRTFKDLSMLTTPIDDLQHALDTAYPDHRQRQLVLYLNPMLKWLGRTETIQPRTKEPRDVKYIPLDKLDSIVEHLPSRAWKVCALIAAYSGLRIGELFALDSRSKLEKGFRVEWQIDRNGKRVRPKRDKIRTVAVFDTALDLFEEWLDLKDEIPMEQRLRAAPILQAACVKATKRTEWHSLRFHDLRHSYAIACAEKGMPLDWIAKQLGDRIEVCEEYYLGFVQTSASMDAAHALLNKKQAG